MEIEIGPVLHQGFSEEISDVNPVTVEYALTCQFDAPMDRVHAAWVEPRQLAQWFGPSDPDRAEVDARPQGSWQLVFSMPDGEDMVLAGRYLEAEAHRLRFTTGDPDTTDGSLASVCTVDFEDHEGSTLMRFRQAGVNTDPAHAEGARDGWVNFFRQLDALL